VPSSWVHSFQVPCSMFHVPRARKPGSGHSAGQLASFPDCVRPMKEAATTKAKQLNHEMAGAMGTRRLLICGTCSWLPRAAHSLTHSANLPVADATAPTKHGLYLHQSPTKKTMIRQRIRLRAFWSNSLGVMPAHCSHQIFKSTTAAAPIISGAFCCP
jgi:hypothetical protein